MYVNASKYGPPAAIAILTLCLGGLLLSSTCFSGREAVQTSLPAAREAATPAHLSRALASALASSDEGGNMLEVVLEGCRLATEGIHTGEGKLTVRRWLKKPDGGELETATRYDVVFAGDRFRVVADQAFVKNEAGTGTDPEHLQRPDSSVREEVAYDGQKLVVFRPDKGSAVIAASHTRTGVRAFSDYRSKVVAMLLPGHDPVHMDDYSLRAPETTNLPARLAGIEEVGGSECLIVEKALSYPVRAGSPERMTETYWFWVDPERDFRVSRVRHWIEGGLAKTKTLFTEVNADLAQYRDGVWLPSKVTRTSYGLVPGSGDTYVKMQQVTTVDPGFKFNGPVSGDQFALALPAGTKVYDELLDARYTAD